MTRLLNTLHAGGLVLGAWTLGPSACSCTQEMEHGETDASIAADGGNGQSDGGAHAGDAGMGDAGPGDGGMGDGGMDGGGMDGGGMDGGGMDGGMDDGGLPDASPG